MPPVIGLNCPWFTDKSGVGMSRTQVGELLPKVIRDTGHQQAQWDYAASLGLKMLPKLQSTSEVSVLSWMAGHPAFCGVVELYNEPFWIGGETASQYVAAWGPVIDQIKASYPTVRVTFAIDDWPTGHNTSPGGTAQWVSDIFALRPSLKTDVYGWAVHPYEDDGPAAALQHLQNCIDALRANGVPNPLIFCTEWGWSRWNTSEANQSAYAKAFIDGAAQKPEVAALCWYQTNDDNEGNRNAFFGLYKLPASGNWSDVWTKAQVWQVMYDAIAASPAAAFGDPPPTPAPGGPMLTLDTNGNIAGIPTGAAKLHVALAATSGGTPTYPGLSAGGDMVAPFPSSYRSPDSTKPWVSLVALDSSGAALGAWTPAQNLPPLPPAPPTSGSYAIPAQTITPASVTPPPVQPANVSSASHSVTWNKDSAGVVHIVVDGTEVGAV